MLQDAMILRCLKKNAVLTHIRLSSFIRSIDHIAFSKDPLLHQFPHTHSWETKTHIHFSSKIAETFDLREQRAKVCACTQCSPIAKSPCMVLRNLLPLRLCSRQKNYALNMPTISKHITASSPLQFISPLP